MNYVVYIEYDFNRTNYLLIQKRIEKVLGKKADGSGCGFGVRDLEFFYDDKKVAIDMTKKLKRLKKEIDIPNFVVEQQTRK